MMKKIFLTLALAALTHAGMAIPAKRVARTVALTDGTEQTVELRGDETFHFYATADGRIVRQNEQGEWEWDLRDVGRLWTQRHAARQHHRSRQAAKMRAMVKAQRSLAPRRAEEVSKKRGLLILVNFSDKKMVNGTLSKVIYDQMLNGLNNPYGSNYGSVREYFRAQSYGQFDIEFDVVGPVTLSQKMSYYGRDEGGEGEDANPGQMIYEACNLVDSQVNFANYDWDGDGEVENIYVTYAGYGQAAGASSNTVWPHQWCLSEAYGKTLKLDGVTIETYATGSELADNVGSTLDGIGTMCHEYSHCLGLPDFYDTSSSGSNFGMGTWSLMDYGCYNGDGYHPCGYTAYERWFSGWLEPKELKEGCVVNNMKNIEDNAEAYVVYNDKSHDEYYLLANHQKTGWDEEAYGHGMMVLHVDYDKYAWEDNTLNNTASRQRMTPIPADNKLQLYTGNSIYRSELAGDLWPGTSRNTALTDTSTPAAKLYRANTDGKKLMHKAIENITEAEGLISFSFMGGKASVASPVVGPLVAEEQSFTASWGDVENAVSYNLLYSEQNTTPGPDDDNSEIEEAITLYETFENFFARGEKEVSASMDDYTDNPGWTGETVYTNEYGARIGTGKATGRLVTPLLQTQTTTISVWFLAYNYHNDTSKLKVSLLSADGKELESQTVNADDENSILVTFTNVPSSYKLEFATQAVKKRVIMGGVVVLEGTFDVEELDYYLFGDSEEEEDEDVANEYDWSNFDWSDVLTSFDMAPRKLQLRRANEAATATAPADAQVIKGITTTSYTVSGLTPGSTYLCQVQAVDGEGNVSAWSAVQTVTLSGDATGIVATKALTSEQKAMWFDLHGRKVAGTPKSGLYIVNGKKVLVR